LRGHQIDISLLRLTQLSAADGLPQAASVPSAVVFTALQRGGRLVAHWAAGWDKPEPRADITEQPSTWSN
jgi:hypothetical protein